VRRVSRHLFHQGRVPARTPQARRQAGPAHHGADKRRFSRCGFRGNDTSLRICTVIPSYPSRFQSLTRRKVTGLPRSSRRFVAVLALAGVAALAGCTVPPVGVRPGATELVTEYLTAIAEGDAATAVALDTEALDARIANTG